MSVGVMTVGVMSVGEITVGVMTVGVMTVGVMRRPRFFMCVYMYVSNHFNHCIKLFAPSGPLIGNKKNLILILILYVHI
jgi:hypothetical protein